MGLFDKKYCDLCGNPLGIIRNKKLSDGHCCDKCKNEFSSLIDKDYRFSVEDKKNI